jgi:hypothetical protein
MLSEPSSRQAIATGYANGRAHLRDELRRIDAFIERRVQAFRQSLPSSRHPLYVSHEEIDAWLAHRTGEVDAVSEIAVPGDELPSWSARIAAGVQQSLADGVVLPLVRLSEIFSLTDFERDALLICLAPMVEPRYRRLYAYLQDDLTRKYAGVDLILDLLSPDTDARWRARRLLGQSGHLLRTGLLQGADAAQSSGQPGSWDGPLVVDPRIVDFLFDGAGLDPRLPKQIRLYPVVPPTQSAWPESSASAPLQALLEHTFQMWSDNPGRAVIHLHGPDEGARRRLARALAGKLEKPLLCFDLRLVDGAGDVVLARLFREALLLQAVVLLEGVDVLRQDGVANTLAATLVAVIDEYGWLTFFSGEKRWPPCSTWASATYYSFATDVSQDDCRKAWQAVLHLHAPTEAAAWAQELAERYRMGLSDIEDTVRTTLNARHAQAQPEPLTLDELGRACRARFQHSLADLARRIEPRHGWEALVLPADRIDQLNEICGQARRRGRVLRDWGFERLLSRGQGLGALFTGAPGTGKTLAAEVIADSLKLDLFKIDLSTIVSKYIGETEKNLSRIFREAEAANGVLFFDEADALFGKRTAVRDSHDRYANIEISFLLQRMEEYSGIVILASNLRENMDEAFTRRLRFIVDFPFPDEADRQRIWRAHFPPQAPLADDIDTLFLARQLPVAGGAIRNIVVNAAFLAAQQDDPISMGHLLNAARREYEKTGKLWPLKTGAEAAPAPARRRVSA